MNPLKTIVLLLFFTSLSFSQSKTVNDTILASQYFKKADSLLAERKLDSAIVYFKKASPIYEKAQAWWRVAGCYNKVSESYWRDSKHEKSLLNARKALEISKRHTTLESYEKANAYENIGKVYSKKSDFDNALLEYKKALNIKLKKAKEKNLGVAKSYHEIGHVYREKGEYRKALEYYEKALKGNIKFYGNSNNETAPIYDNIGDVYNKLGKYDIAIENFKKALQTGSNDLKIADYYTNLGYAFLNKLEKEKALECFEKSLTINELNQDKIGMALSNRGIGMVNLKKRLSIKALEYYNKSLEIEINFFGKNNYLLAPSYRNIGIVYYNLEMYKEAEYYFKKSSSILRSKFGKNHPKLISNYYNMGLLHKKKKQYDKALEYYEIGLSIILNTYGKNHYYVGKSYVSFGATYFESGNFERALHYFTRSGDVFKENYGEDSAILINTYNWIGAVYLKNNEYCNSIDYYDKSIKINLGKIEANKKSIDLSYFNDLRSLLISLKGKSKCLKYLYEDSANINYLVQAKNIHEKTDSIFNFLRRKSTNYKDKIQFSKTAKSIFLGSIETQLLLHNKTKIQEDINRAFYYLERSKSNTLKDLLNDSNAKSFSGLSEGLVALEKDLRIDKAFYQSKVNEEVSNKQMDSTKLSNYENKLFGISRRQDSLTKILEEDYPKYYQLKYKNEVISVAEIQQKLNDKTTLLEFFTADSITYAFTISKNKITVKELLTPKLTDQIEQFRASMTKNYEEYKDSSHVLYQKLIAPIQDQFVGTQLIIVPDGPLWHLNFDLLLTQEDASNNPKDWSYLLEKYAISYANSATLLFGNKVQQDTVSNKRQECLAFSFSSGDNIANTRNLSLKTFRNSSMDLPGTREEIKAIANIVDGNYFYGSEATEQNFKKHVGAYSILHLALHGDVDNERPENSKLYFTKSKDTLEDNYLYSHELFALDIPAELTVLSACNTGTGKIAKGEGIMSLGNAFQYAGTKSLLLTNWEVSDQTTPKIMEYFYKNLKDGKNKAEALQQAKLQFLATTNEETIHPYYWGGFYLLGDTAPIKFQDNSYVYWVIGFGVLAIISLSLFWYRKQHSK
ncbi:CHAT domain-containing protein [uncultured Aquimarina sp.]|uniref:CHAT domain-containing protein n=1 Tax=uncultured Aquimarina sp. TaxID=575652 RepID=UPI002611EAE1|nr:CHAT domain-containing protein [uncultured Aquimarina sp.]